MRCIASTFAFIFFFGLITLFVLPSLLVYFLIYPFTKYPQDIFQGLSSILYKIFFKLFPHIELHLDLLEKLPKSAIYISTHQSNLDYPILGSFVKRYLIMTNLKFENIPFISLVGRLIGIRYRDNKNLGKVAHLNTEFGEMLNQERNVMFFVEGTRDDGERLLPFKKGAFRLAKKMSKPLIPIIIDGSAKILKKGNFCFSSIEKRVIHVRMLQPIYPEMFDTQEDMLEFAFDLMQYTKGEYA